MWCVERCAGRLLRSGVSVVVRSDYCYTLKIRQALLSKIPIVVCGLETARQGYSASSSKEQRHCELGTAAVASSRTTDLPAIIRFLIVHHLSAENAAGFGSGAPPARERVQHVAPRRAYKSCVSGAAGSVLGPIGTTTAAGGHPCSSCCSTARRRAVDGQGTQHAAG